MTAPKPPKHAGGPGHRRLDLRRLSMPGQAPYDKWSLVHVASGAALGLLGVPGHWMLAALLGFEVLEAGLRRIPRRSTGGGLFEPESWANVGADVVVGALGWYATAWWAPLASW